MESGGCVQRRARWGGRLGAALCVALAACGGASEEGSDSAGFVLEDAPRDVAVLEVEGFGEIRIELLPELAPRTVAHFRELATGGRYDGTTFHRVVPGFVIQGGDPFTRNADPRDDGRGGWQVRVPAEFNDLPYQRGVVGMARSSGTDSGSQFFIVQEALPAEGPFTFFGRVVDGMDVVDAISEVEIDLYGRYGPKSRPYPEDVVVERVRIEPASGIAAASASG